MQYRSEGKSALLIGRELGQNLEIISALSQIDIKRRFSDSGYDGIGELYRNNIEIVIIDANVSDIRPHEICRQIKLSNSHQGVPVICIYKGDTNINEVLDAFHAGADDCFTGKINTTQFMAKVEWLITRRNSTAALRQYYSELRGRQTQTLDVVKSTAELLESIDAGFRGRAASDGFDNNDLFEEKFEIGIGLIKSLASILENQIESFDISELIEQTDAPNSIDIDRNFRSLVNPKILGIAG